MEDHTNQELRSVVHLRKNRSGLTARDKQENVGPFATQRRSDTEKPSHKIDLRNVEPLRKHRKIRETNLAKRVMKRAQGLFLQAQNNQTSQAIQGHSQKEKPAQRRTPTQTQKNQRDQSR